MSIFDLVDGYVPAVTEVNGVAESRRGRQLQPGDVVTVGEEQVRVTLQPGAPDRP